ncbi:MAG: hypothetical protein HY908_26665 [Myxococcales bacterium]|nr:hypothetical protein [Myxococcales bacterium]
MLDAERLGRLGRAQATLVAAALVSEEARAGFGALVAGALAAVLARPVGELVDVGALGRALDAAIAAQTAERSLAPLLAEVGQRAARAIARRPEPLGAFVPDAARRELDALLGEPGIVDAALVRAVAEDPAIEAAMRDVLYDALSEFSRNVNPFTADWGLPGLLDKLFPLGKGALKKALTGMREDFERRLEPETRKFIGGFARRALRKLAESAIDKSDEPEAVALRRRIAALVLARKLDELAWPADDPKIARLRAVAGGVLGATLSSAALREELVRELGVLVGEHGALSLAALLARWGVAPPDPQPLAAALWPVARAALGSDAVRSALEVLLTASLVEAAARGA